MSQKQNWISRIGIKQWQLFFWIPALLGAVLLYHVIDDSFDTDVEGTKPIIHSGAWGDLQEWDILLEQPAEFVGFEKTTTKGPFWGFGNLTPQAVRSILDSAGCTEEQSLSLLGSRVEGTGSVVVLNPNDKTLLSLSPETRSKLYLALAANSANRWQASPFFVAEGDIDKAFYRISGVFDSVIPMIRKLVYNRNGFTYFSDPEIILRNLPSDEVRMDFLQALTAQNVVLLQVLVRSKSDIDKPLYYWAPSMPGVTLKDVAPLLKAMRREPQGGAVSVIHFLPPLAREKLFTSYVPPQLEQSVTPDCHWTALNYFNVKPDPRMADNAYASRYIQEHYYQVASPGIPGDLVLVMNAAGEVLHSSVYIADDIVFTKNGVNYAQPWVLMRIKRMQGTFSHSEPTHIAYFRKNGI